MHLALLSALVMVWLRVLPATFTAAASIPASDPDAVPDAFARPGAALMWPGATRAFLVEPDGGLYNGVWRVDIVAGAGGRRADPPRRIAYEDRWLPIAHWTERAGDVRWDFEAVALPAPEGPLAPLARELGAW